MMFVLQTLNMPVTSEAYRDNSPLDNSPSDNYHPDNSPPGRLPTGTIIHKDNSPPRLFPTRTTPHQDNSPPGLFPTRTRRAHFQNLINPLLVFLRKTGFFDNIYTHVYGKTKFRRKKCVAWVIWIKFHSVTSSNVILYNDVKNSIFHQNLIYQVLEINSFHPARTSEELYVVGVVLARSCPSGELSWWGVVLEGICPGGDWVIGVGGVLMGVVQCGVVLEPIGRLETKCCCGNSILKHLHSYMLIINTN